MTSQELLGQERSTSQRGRDTEDRPGKTRGTAAFHAGKKKNLLIANLRYVTGKWSHSFCLWMCLDFSNNILRAPED